MWLMARHAEASLNFSDIDVINTTVDVNNDIMPMQSQQFLQLA